MFELLDEKEVARILHCTAAALRHWRREGRGPQFIRVERCIRYRESDLVQYIEKNTCSKDGGSDDTSKV
jgi:hypothetical protein